MWKSLPIELQSSLEAVAKTSGTEPVIIELVDIEPLAVSGLTTTAQLNAYKLAEYMILIGDDWHPVKRMQGGFHFWQDPE